MGADSDTVTGNDRDAITGSNDSAVVSATDSGQMQLGPSCVNVWEGLPTDALIGACT